MHEMIRAIQGKYGTYNIMEVCIFHIPSGPNEAISWSLYCIDRDRLIGEDDLLTQN